MPVMPKPGRLSLLARTWRVSLATLVCAVLVASALVGNDDWFPFGPMAQFAFRAKPDGVISSVHVEADTTAGRHVRVPLTTNGVGIQRAEIEGQLGAFKRHPAKLQAIADAWRVRHPRQPRYTRIYLIQQGIRLHDGRPSGRYAVTLAVWNVR